MNDHNRPPFCGAVDRDDRQACKTPLVDLLAAIPSDARMIYDQSPTESQNIPVGRLAAEACQEIKRLRHALQVALPALENGAEALAIDADRYHAEMKGYRTAEHKRRDDEAKQAHRAVDVVKAALRV
jgi:hypothetical protein